jgi:hypothetical protein
MSNTTHLDPSHYASQWTLPKEGEFNDLGIVNQAGIDYANLLDGPAKEEKLLEIVRYFHGYIFKYAELITRGHLPSHSYNSDTRRFLKYFLPAESTINTTTFSKVTKHLHLAFPQQSATDVYDILNVLLLRCVKKYDPNYVDKVRDIVKVIQKIRKKQFTIEYIAKKVSFNPTGGIRLLARKEYIKAIRGPRKKLIGYKITKSWPPSQEFLSSGPVGFVYFIQTWFRYYLQEYIDEQMKTIEARAWDKMLQIEHRSSDLDTYTSSNENIISSEGELTDIHGISWSADLSMMNKCLDLSEITPAWVNGTTDKLFHNMTVRERHLIYLYYVQELSWKQISETLHISINQTQRIHDDILTFLKIKFHLH